MTNMQTEQTALGGETVLARAEATAARADATAARVEAGRAVEDVNALNSLAQDAFLTLPPT